MLAIIPARVGSKGIPRKNFKLLAGVSPLKRAVDCALSIDGLHPLVTSDASLYSGAMIQTGDELINAPLLAARPPLHTDECSMVDIVADVLARVPGPPDEIVLLLQPTQPLREAKHLRAVIALLEDGLDHVATVVETEPAEKLYYPNFEPVIGRSVEWRQGAEPTYRCDGTCYGFRRAWFIEERRFVTPHTLMLLIPPEESAKLDTPFDWQMAELRLKARSGR